MCGIFGYFGDGLCKLKEATDIIEHRGPDSDGFLGYDISGNSLYRHLDRILDLSDQRVLFGFRRLSVIDLSHGSDQPFSIPELGLHIVFNGEIYNYKELKTELQGLGRSFRSNSDTEVLLQSYAEWGKDCLNKFNGMWAFAILDTNRSNLFCARDRFGVKPFFYCLNADSSSITFGSEIKQLLVSGIGKEINLRVVRDFVEKSVVDHTEETFYKGIYKLLPGNYFELDLREKTVHVRPQRFYRVTEQKEYGSLSFKEAQETFYSLFADSVNLRFRSDVPVGSCLSGGLDSSSIISVASATRNETIHAFTSRFDIPEVDESEYVRMVGEMYPNVKNHYCSITENNFLNEFEKVLWHQDEPFGSMSILSQWEVMKLAKANNVTVLLDGQGGDELLGGYRKFYAFFLREKLQKREFGSFFKNAAGLLASREFNFFNKEGILRYLGIRGKSKDFFSPELEALPLLSNIGLGGSDSYKSRSLQDIEQYSYPPLLRYEDRNSMAFSIETRVPFMDYRLVDFLFSLPIDYLIHDGFTKVILRESLKGVLPEKIRTRKSKLGFASPQKTWMASTLYPHFHAYFSTMDNPYFNAKAIVKEFEKYPSNFSNSDMYFRIYCLDNWMKSLR